MLRANRSHTGHEVLILIFFKLWAQEEVNGGQILPQRHRTGIKRREFRPSPTAGQPAPPQQATSLFRSFVFRAPKFYFFSAAR